MNEFIYVWPGWNLIVISTDATIGHRKRTRNRLIQRRKHQIEVLNMLTPALVSGEHGATVSDSDVQAWLNKIQLSSSSLELRDKHNFLSLGIKKGIEELNWQLQPIPLLGKIEQDKSVTIDNFEQQANMQIALGNLQLLLQDRLWLTDPAERLPEKKTDKNEIAKILWGQILCSAALYGGLMELSTLYSLLYYHQDHLVKLKDSPNCWITFFEDRVQPAWLRRLPPSRRWYTDEVTHMLLAFWQQQGWQKYVPATINNNHQSNYRWQDQCLLSFLKIIGLQDYSRHKFLQNVAIHWRIKLPSFVVYHCYHFGKYTALPDTIIESMARDKARPRLSLGKTTNTQYLANKKDLVDLQVQIDDLKSSRTAIITLKKALYKQEGQQKLSGTTITSVFTTLLQQNDISPITLAVIAWLYSHHQKNKPSTLYKYLTMIGGELIDRLGTTPITSENTATITQTYQLILDEASSQFRRNDKFNRLRDFQRYLHDVLGGPYIDMTQFATGGDTQGQASANMISENEYQRISAYFATKNDEENIFLHWIFVILFRTGLRITEVLTLQLKDIQWTKYTDGELWLHVHSNKYATVKSADAVRRIPLHITLTPAEKVAFLGFLNEADTTRKTTGLLFSLEINHAKPIPENKVRSALQYAMRGLTGNNTLTLHHLRHSFANHVFAALLDIKLPFSTPEHYVGLKKLAIYQRSYLYLLADLMGHHSPEITISSYIHIMDLVLRSYLANYTNPQSDMVLLQWGKIISSLEQITPEVWRKRLQRCSDDLFSPCTSSKFQPKTTTIHSDLITPTATILPLSVPQHKQMIELNLASITELLRQLENGRRYEEIAMRFHIEPDALPALELAIYRTMMAISKHNGYRHIRPHNNKYNGVAKEGFPAVSWHGMLHIMRPPVGNNGNQANYVYKKNATAVTGASSAHK